MANNKKSFVLYCDLIHTINKLPNEKAGELFKHILEYVNDNKPETDDLIIDLTFEPIKQSLKRDLVKWSNGSETRSEKARKAGLASAEARKNKQLNPTQSNSLVKNQLNPTQSTVSVSVSDSVNENVIYTKALFLVDWNILREKHLGKPSHLNILRGEDLDNFNDIIKDYKESGVEIDEIRDSFKVSLIGLFKQKKLPNDNKVMQSNPKHFLKYFNTYLTAYHDKNTALYGENKKEY